MKGIVRSLYRYPIKGLSAEPLYDVALTKGTGFPRDRAYGFARADSGFDPNNPKPLPKTKFLMLAREEQLAMYDTRLDDRTGVLTIVGQGHNAAFDITTPVGRAQASDFLAKQLDIPRDQQPVLYSAEPHRFTDVSVVSPQMMNAVSLLNLDSVSHFAKIVGRNVDPARFRANVHFSGFPALSELDLVGRRISVGNTTMKVILRTKRCPATEVNPDTGIRDLDTPTLLQKHFGHSDMGIYAEVISGGSLSSGEEIRVID